MNRIDTRFAQLQSAGRKALVPFVTAGDPTLESTVPVMHALVEAGADVIELGVPFSDPMADGPTIQRSSERALARGSASTTCWPASAPSVIATPATPIVLMATSIRWKIRGPATFARLAADAGVDGILLVDLPARGGARIPRRVRGRRRRADPACVADVVGARIDMLRTLARGYLYYVSFAGVTGADRLDTGAAGERLR